MFTLILVIIAEGDPSKPGVARGPCPTSSGVPSGLFTIFCLNFFVYIFCFTFFVFIFLFYIFCLQLQKLKNNKLMPLLPGVILVMDLLAQLSKWIYKIVKKDSKINGNFCSFILIKCSSEVTYICTLLNRNFTSNIHFIWNGKWQKSWYSDRQKWKNEN